MMKIGRETVDLDFLLTRMTAEVKALQEVFEEIVSTSSDDGFSFSFEGIELLSQPHMEYPGYRTIFKASFAKMKDKIHVDVGVGDIVEPQNREIKLFKYRGKPINIVGHGSTEFVVLRSKYPEAEGLIYLTARNKDFRTYCISNMTGTSGRKRISGTQIGAYKMAIPPIKVILQFAQQTTNIFKKIGGLHNENQQLTQLRDWLLPMLMNGQVMVQ